MIPINSLLNNGEGFNFKMASSRDLDHNDNKNPCEKFLDVTERSKLRRDYNEDFINSPY